MTALAADTATIFRRELIRYRRDRAYWAGQLLFPLVVVGFIGFGMNDVVRLPTGTDYLGHLASGMLALLVGSGGVGGGMTLIQERESGFLRTLLVAPISRGSIVLGKLAARLLGSILLAGVLVAILSLFTPVGLAHPGAALLAICAITASFLALGIALASSLRNLESFRLWAALVTVPLYFLSGIFYPVSTLPAPMQILSWANPLTYGVDLLRYGLLGVNELPLALCVPLLAGLTGVTLLLAIQLFDRDPG